MSLRQREEVQEMLLAQKIERVLEEHCQWPGFSKCGVESVREVVAKDTPAMRATTSNFALPQSSGMVPSLETGTRMEASRNGSAFRIAYVALHHRKLLTVVD